MEDDGKAWHRLLSVVVSLGWLLAYNCTIATSFEFCRGPKLSPANRGRTMPTSTGLP